MVRMPNKAETPARVQELQRQVRELFASANQSARSAQSSANTAQSTATTAQSTAATAQSTATSAQTTATSAQTTATTANTAAQTAQTAAQQASTDAAAANTNASTAQTAAQTAQQQAQAAQQAAAAKTKTTWSTAVPDNTQNPGTTDGDVWYVTNGTGGNATAQYRWSASNSQWLLTPIDGTALRNIVADSITSGTFTGLKFRSAASGRRVEITDTTLAVYSATQTSPVGGMSARDDGSFSSVDILNSYSPLGTTYMSVTVPRNVAAGSLSSSRPVNLQVSLGVEAPLMQCRALTMSKHADATYPVIGVGPASDTTMTYVTSDVFRLGSELGRPVVFGEGGSNFAPSRVIVQADEYRRSDGTSFSADSGWLTPTVAGTSGYNVNTLRYRKIGNRVEWTGQLNRTSNMAAQSNVITVPTAYAPSVPSGGTTRIFSATGTAGTSFRFNFNTNGQIDIRDIANGTTTYAILDGITYLTD